MFDADKIDQRGGIVPIVPKSILSGVGTFAGASTKLLAERRSTDSMRNGIRRVPVQMKRQEYTESTERSAIMQNMRRGQPTAGPMK